LKCSTHAGDRESLKQRWKEALETGVNLVEEIKIPFPEEKNTKLLSQCI
jgi:predicted RNase H-like HicB family nuclease